jgi:hypothetical protein
MKLASIKNLMLAGALLAFGSLTASAGTVDCNTQTTLLALQQMTQNGDSCLIGGLGGGTDQLFSNFAFQFDVNPTDGSITPPSAGDIAAVFSISGDAYTLVFDFSPANAGANPAAVAAGQSMDFSIAYEVTITDPSQSIYEQDATVSGGLLSFGGFEDATVSATVAGCQNAAFSGPPPSATCLADGVLPLNETWTTSTGNGSELTALDPDNMDIRTDQTLPALNATSFGVLLQASLNGDDMDTGTPTAALFSMSSTLDQGAAPEPGTFILIGGVLVALGAFRRSSKKAA